AACWTTSTSPRPEPLDTDHPHNADEHAVDGRRRQDEPVTSSDEMRAAQGPRRRRWHQRPFLLPLLPLFTIWVAAHFYEIPPVVWGLPPLVATACSVSLKRARQREQARRVAATSV
ncbi:hypothetical protein, partial [Kineococcus sp. G2]|uniref:hypothetical protein n=1 Tax=Kineococcus sp. G2 TaxID=3127484 RepID=UPI00301C5E3D